MEMACQEVFYIFQEKTESVKGEYTSLLGSRWVRHRVVKDSLTSRSSTATITTIYLAHLSLPVCIVARCHLGMPFLRLLFEPICMSKKNDISCVRKYLGVTDVNLTFSLLQLPGSGEERRFQL